jgi:hypothetical protein
MSSLIVFSSFSSERSVQYCLVAFYSTAQVGYVKVPQHIICLVKKTYPNVNTFPAKERSSYLSKIDLISYLLLHLVNADSFAK